MILEPNIRYYPDTDTMAIELRPYPTGPGGDPAQVGGQDEGEDLVVHYAADGGPWLWRLSTRPRIPNISPRRYRKSGAARRRREH